MYECVDVFEFVCLCVECVCDCCVCVLSFVYLCAGVYECFVCSFVSNIASVSVFVLTLFLCVSLPPYFRLCLCALVCLYGCMSLSLCVCAYVSVLCIFASVPHYFCVFVSAVGVCGFLSVYSCLCVYVCV